MTEAHGTRRQYQRARCRCTPCKAAEAAYRARLRARHARGQPILGSHASASTTWRLLRSLRIEGFTKAEIARRLGLRRPRLSVHPERVTLRTVLRVQWLYRTVMSEPSDSFDSRDYATRWEAPQRRGEEG
jgi:hypothetical protein